MENDPAEAPAGMNIVTKAGLLLSALYNRGELSPAQLTEELDEPMSSVYRLISNLEALGWVERGTRRGVVRLGLAFVKIGRSLESQFDIRQIALPQMQALSQSTGETAVLVIRRGSVVVCVERSEGTEVLSQSFRLGESHPLHKSAASRAVLAFEPDSVLEGLLQSAADGSDSALDDLDPARLRAQLDEVRADGTSFSDSDVNPGMAAIAAPIFNHRGEVVAALSVSGLRDRVVTDAAELTAGVRAAAEAVSSALGHESASEPARQGVEV